MSKIITTTFLLKNPAKVREMVAKGITLLVKHQGKIVMQITVPLEDTSKKKIPKPITSNQPDFTFNREDLYSGKYD